MKIIESLLKLAGIVLLGWIGWSLHKVSTTVLIPEQLNVALTQPVSIEATKDLSVRGQMVIDIDRMPFDRGDPIHVKLENDTGLSPWRITVDR